MKFIITAFFVAFVGAGICYYAYTFDSTIFCQPQSIRSQITVKELSPLVKIGDDQYQASGIALFVSGDQSTTTVATLGGTKAQVNKIHVGTVITNCDLIN